jgi:hypothetical protein
LQYLLPNDAVDIVELRNRPVIERVAAARELRIVDLFQGPSKPGPGSSLLDNDRNESELKMSTAFFTLQAIGTGAHASIATSVSTGIPLSFSNLASLVAPAAPRE